MGSSFPLGEKSLGNNGLVGGSFCVGSWWCSSFFFIVRKRSLFYFIFILLSFFFFFFFFCFFILGIFFYIAQPVDPTFITNFNKHVKVMFG